MNTTLARVEHTWNMHRFIQKQRWTHHGRSKQKHFQNKRYPPTVFLLATLYFPNQDHGLRLKWLIQEKKRKKESEAAKSLEP